jgi:hypothetical protein
MEWFGCRQQMKMFISKICSDDDHRVEYRNKSTIVSKHANTFQEIQYLVHYQHLVMEMHFDLLDQSISWASLCIPNPSQEPPFPPSIKQNHIYPSPTLPLFSSLQTKNTYSPKTRMTTYINIIRGVPLPEVPLRHRSLCAYSATITDKENGMM